MTGTTPRRCTVHPLTVHGAPPDGARCTPCPCTVHPLTVHGAPPAGARCTPLKTCKKVYVRRHVKKAERGKNTALPSFFLFTSY